MAKLIVNPTSPHRQELVLPRTPMSIGRDPSNDLVLPDAMVSRRHAVVELRAGQFYLRDCNSSNGSLVNGDRVNERSLRDGDLVAIGTARLLFREDVEALDPAGKVVQHPSAPRLRCAQCGADYRRGDLFCKQCGGGLQVAQPKAVCTACGTAVPMPARFCNACGARVGPDDGLPLEPTNQRPVGLPEADATPASPTPPEGYQKPDVEAPAQAQAVGSESIPAPGPMSSPPPVSLVPQPQPPAFAPAREAPPREPAPVFPAEKPAAVLEAVPELRPVARAQPPAPAREKTVPPPPREKSLPPQPRPPAAAAPRSLPPPLAQSAPRSSAPELGPRMLAGLIDFAGVAMLQTLLLAPAAQYWWSRDISAGVAFTPIALTLALVMLTLALGALYFIYSWAVRGATFGKQLVGLVVESTEGDCPIGFLRATGRFLGYLVSGVLLGGGFLLIAIEGQGLHDRLAGTRVVKRD